MANTVRNRLATALLAFSATATATSEARAVTLADLREDGFQSIYGNYARGGDCRVEPVVTIDQSGLSFKAGDTLRHSDTFDYAVSFFGPDYSGISYAFFPFPTGEYEPGHVLMYVNADEIPGKLSFEDNLGPGETMSEFEALLVRSTPFLRCEER